MWRVLGLVVLFCAVVSQLAVAKPLTPLEKAMKAIAEKENQTEQAQGTTPTAKTYFWMPGQSSDTQGNSATAQPALTVEHVMTMAKGIYPCGVSTTADPLAVDPFALTSTATAEFIRLSWSNTGTAYKTFGGYLIHKAIAEETMCAAINTPQATASYQDATVTAKTKYVYQVTALDTKGQTLVASWPIVTQLAPSVPPDVPTELKTSVREERLQLQWKPVKRTSHDVQGYLIYRSKPNEKIKDSLNNSPVAKAEYYDSSGKLGELYEYQIATVDTRGQTSAVSTTVTGFARPRSRNGLVLMSTAYRGMGLTKDVGFTGDMQFTYYIGTLYGEQDEELSPLGLYLDPISLWLLTADLKYTFFTEEHFPVAAAAGGKGGALLFAGQQSSSSGTFSFSEKSELDYIWGAYASLSRSFGDLGIHGGYLFGSMGDPIYYLSKFMRYEENERTRNLFFAGVDFPITRRMNVALEIMYPLNANLESDQHPVLVNLHVDRLLNFDISYLHWDQGWAFLGYFNIRFTVYPSDWKKQ
jgi:hypothetical protein